MEYRTFTIQGIRVYVTASLEECIEGIIDLISASKRLRDHLIDYKKIVIKKKTRFEDPDAVLEFICTQSDLFAQYELEMLRIVNSYKNKVTEINIASLNTLIEYINIEKVSVKYFKRDYINKDLEDERIRPILDEIDGRIRGHYFALTELIDILSRVKLLIGTSPEEKKEIKENITPKFKNISAMEVSGKLSWADIHIKFISKEIVQIFINSVPHDALGFKQVGLQDKRTKGPNDIWEMLIKFATLGGEFSPDQYYDKKKTISRLREWLKLFFDIKESPISRYNRSTKTYKANFMISAYFGENLY